MEKLTKQQIDEQLASLTGWQYQNESLQKEIEFADFKTCFSLMTRIAFEAEAMQHHPNWSNVYNTLTINLSTHDAGGVTVKDFKLAEKIDAIIQ